ncbi:tRNA-dihydrouridine synthase B [uncultured archaeon]|nr:tRNA-dihydrouridine synthase B [uncultured archaeon]
MQIGSISIPSSPVLALAPMAGYTDAALRTLIAARGADLVFSELSSAAALSRAADGKQTNPKATDSIIQVGAGGITGIQVFGSSEREVGEAVARLRSLIESGECKARLIDINYGCPAPKVTRNGSGSALLQDEKKVAAVAEAAVKAAGSIPVTAKIRLGWRSKNNVQVARALEQVGIAAITVHGRTAAQKFSGKSDWNSIGEVVRAVSVPVFGNGDVKEPADVQRICEVSGCPGVMVGRAALSNPLFFSQARQYLQHGRFEPTTWNDKLVFMREYLALMPRYGLAFHLAKELSMQLATGLRGSAKMRGELMKAKDGPELMAVMERPAGARKGGEGLPPS